MSQLNQQMSQNILCKMQFDITLPSILEPVKSSLQIFEIRFFVVGTKRNMKDEKNKRKKERRNERKGKEGSKRRQLSPA